MLNLSKTVALLAAVAIPLATFANANSIRVAPVNTTPINDLVVKTGSRLTGKQRLKRLMSSHIRAGNPILQSVRDATGDPNIVVFDRRGGSSFENYRCSYITYRSKRALTCD